MLIFCHGMKVFFENQDIFEDQKEIDGINEN